MVNPMGLTYVNRQLPNQLPENYKQAKLGETIVNPKHNYTENVAESYLPMLILANKVYWK